MGELDREIAALNAKQTREEETRSWLSRYWDWYDLRTAVPLGEIPYIDVVEDFTARAIDSRIGIPVFLLKGPDGNLHVFRHVPIRNLSGLSWGEKRQRRRVQDELRLKGISGFLFRFKRYSYDSIDVHGNWIYSEGLYYSVEGDLLEKDSQWPNREDFVKLCAEALHKGEALS